MNISLRQITWLVIPLMAVLTYLPINYAHSKEAGNDTTAELWRQAAELKQAGYYAKAIPFIEKVFMVQKAFVPVDKTELARTLDCLGELHYLAGQYTEAEPLLTESLFIRKEVDGPDHIHTAESYNHLGELYWLVGRSDESGSHLRKALSIREKTYGPNHPYVAETLVNLARLQVDLSNPDEAETLLQTALDMQEKNDGVNPSDLVKILNTLAWLHLDNEEFEKAEPYIHRALTIGENLIGPEHPFVADSMNYLGRLQYARNEYEASIATTKRALAIRKKCLGSDHPDVGLSLNNLALPYCNLEQYETARSLFVRALSIREKAFGKNHPNLLVMLQNAGWVHEVLGDYAGAVSFYERALAINEQVHGTDSIQVATCRKELAVLYYYLGDAEKAEVLLNETIAVFERELGPDHLRVASNLSYLAFICKAREDYSRSEKLYKRAVAIGEKHYETNPTNLGAALSNLASLYADMGEYEKGESNYRRSLSITEKALGSEHTQVAVVLNNMGMLFGKLSDYLKAETAYLRALAIWESALGTNHPNVATTLDNLAMLYEDSGEYKKAEPLFQRSLKIRENLFGPVHPDVARTVNNLASLYSFLGDYEKAVELYQRALETKAETIGTRNTSYANSLHNLAAVRLKLEQYEEAETLYTQALEIWKQVYGSDHPDVSTGYGHLSQLYADMGDFEQSYDYAMKSLLIENTLISQVIGFTSEKQKIQFITSNNWGLHYCLDLVSQHFIQEQTKRKDVLDIWIKRKGIILDVQRKSQEASLASGDEEAARLFAQLSGVRTELSQLIFTHNRADENGYRPRIAALQSERDRLEAQLSRVSKPFAMKRDIARADSEQVANTLPPSSVLIEFARIETDYFDSTDDQSLPDRYLAFIIEAGNSEKVDMIDLGRADKTDSLITQYKNQLAVSGKGGAEDANVTATALYDRVFRPIQKSIGKAKNIFISPDGNLNLIPFEILQKPDGSFLIDELTFNYLAAGRDLLGVANDRKLEGSCLLMGAPDFNMTSLNTSFDSKEPAKRYADLSELSFAPLPHTKTELDDISKVMGASHSDLYIGKDALEETLLNASHPAIIHLATHGFFLSDQELPGAGRGFQMAALPNTGGQSHSQIKGKIDIKNPLLRSGILLAGAKRSLTDGSNGRHDGIVTAEEILGMNLHGTEMVVLSACDTGLGDVKSGEGVFGLRRAFTQAGAKSLVMSLWKVPDQETKELMVQFYRNIKSGKMNRCQALRQAILKEKEIVRKRYGHDNPRYWGAFVFMGQP